MGYQNRDSFLVFLVLWGPFSGLLSSQDPFSSKCPQPYTTNLYAEYHLAIGQSEFRNGLSYSLKLIIHFPSGNGKASLHVIVEH